MLKPIAGDIYEKKWSGVAVRRRVNEVLADGSVHFTVIGGRCDGRCGTMDPLDWEDYARVSTILHRERMAA